jgi:hypothetical protein
MPSSWYASNHQKTALQITAFLFIVIIISAIIQLFFPNKDPRDPSNKNSIKTENNTIQKGTSDTLKR